LASSVALPAALAGAALLAYQLKSTLPVGMPCAPVTAAASWTTEPMGALVIALLRHGSW
jgi:hypothetical protein